ncbi:uncharacterized protein LOC105645187 isoform X2 [Jatropha curcas]|uniref:uncharacterized protein LOC105645187 isoform X2 n=1 Tax=Jatropha curcas TaxID=180498 RepID=UPI001893F373|nr:uncharacterized protein LOC105645187 isoform X2 [Jatropha curcas]
MEPQEALIWKSESSESPESMVSVRLGRALTILLGARSRKLHDSISRISPDSNKRPSLGSLEDSLWFLHKFVKDAVERDHKLDDILIPIIQHSLRSKDLKHGGQALILINWLFQDEFFFQAVVRSLADIIDRKDDRYIALGWCILIRGLVEYERFVDHYTLNGIKDNYYALLKILCSCVPCLSHLVCRGSTLQDGFELPSRLSVSAADCILAITEALTKKNKVSSNNPKLLNSDALHRPISLVPAVSREKKAKPAHKSSEESTFDMAYLLWDLIGELITLTQRLLAWSRKSRPLHAKGLEQVVKWLQGIKGQYSCIQDEAGPKFTTGANFPKAGALLLSSCWKHYNVLLHLEDHNFPQHCNELLDQYISGIQYYTDSHAEGITENKDAGVETRKFFLNCLCLLLGRLDGKKFESIMSEYGMQISRILLSQLHCADEDVVAAAVCILKKSIFKPNYSSGKDLTDSRQMDVLLPSLLNLLDENDGIARAVVMLIAEYCSMSINNNCLKQVLKRLASGNASQRRNAIDIVSQLVCMSSDSANKLSDLTWQDIANNLIERLSDEEIAIRHQASKLISMIDPSLVMPALVHLLYSSDEGLSYASTAFTAMLQYHNQKPEVICMLLDCLSNIRLDLDLSKSADDLREGPKLDIDRVLMLMPEWSKSVQDWNSMIGPLIDKMFAEPSNATIVRFLSYISEHLAEAADVVLHRVLLQMQSQKGIKKGLLSRWESKSCQNEDLMGMQQSLFERLCPLLIIRLLPLRVFNDLNSFIMYGQLPVQGITHENRDVNNFDDCVAAFLLQRAFNMYEFEDVRKLAAELCGRIHPQVLFPIVSSLLEDAAKCEDVLIIKACLFAICTSLVVRGRESVSHPIIIQIRKTIETVLLWPSLDGDEVSKAQHGCIDCLALMICAELPNLESFKNSEKFSLLGKTSYAGNSILAYVIHQLTSDKNEVPVCTLTSENCEHDAPVLCSFRLCMANVLLSACQKLSDSGKKLFARETLPRLISSVEVIKHAEIRAACVQVLFSAVYHLKSAVLPYSADLLKLSLNFLQTGSEKEKMAGAKLMASLMASEDTILESISKGLLGARQVLSRISASDPSNDLQVVCKKLLACITSP